MRAMIIRPRARPRPAARRRSCPHSAGPYIALVLIGFAIGILGHLSTARWLVAAGIDPDLPRRLPLPAGAQPDRGDPAQPSRSKNAASRTDR